MTLPYEQYNAIVNTRNFLVSLMDREQTKVPLAIRKEARRLLKHFPSEYEANDLIKNHTEWLHKINMNLEAVDGNRDPIEYSPRNGGWIFWDETAANFHGPFFTRRDAADALNAYLQDLG